MNYARHRLKLQEKQKELAKMSGQDRTLAEAHIISQNEEKIKEELPKSENLVGDEQEVAPENKPGNKNGPKPRK